MGQQGDDVDQYVIIGEEFDLLYDHAGFNLVACCQTIRAPAEGGRVRIAVGPVINSDTAIEHSGVAVEFPSVQVVSTTCHLCKALVSLSSVHAITLEPVTHSIARITHHSTHRLYHPLTIARDCNPPRASVAEERVHETKRFVLSHRPQRGQRVALSQRLPTDVEGSMSASEEGRDFPLQVAFEEREDVGVGRACYAD